MSDKPGQFVQVTNSGRIHAFGVELHASLGRDPGTYQLEQLGRGAWRLSRRAFHPPEGQIEHPIDLSGSANTFGGAAQLISLLTSNHDSGVFTFIEGPYRRTLVFARGFLTKALSNDRFDRLGEVLYRSGVMSRGTLQTLLQQAESKGLQIGQHLVQTGVLSADELSALLRRQAEDILLAILSAEPGDFAYGCEYRAEPGTSSLELDQQHFLFNGVRRLDELNHIESRLMASPRARLRFLGEPHSESRPVCMDLERLLEQPLSVTELLKQLSLPRRHALESLQLLLTEGKLSVEQAETTQQTSTEPQPISTDHNIQLIERFNQLFSMLRQSGDQEPHPDLNRTLRTFLQFYGYTTLFDGVVVDQEGTLEPAHVLSNLVQLKHASGATEYLKRALSELLHFALFALRGELDRDQYRILQERASGLFNES